MLTSVVLYLMVGPSAAEAQHASWLSGEVVDSISGDALHGAHVLLDGTSKGTSTDAAGQYVLRDLEAGSYTLRISYLGYETHREELTLAPGEGRTLDVGLAPEDVEAGEVVVTAAGAAERAVAVERMPIEFVHDLPAVLEPDLFRSLQLLPGIQAASDYSSGLYIRGGSPDQTLVQLNHTTIYNPTHFFGFFSTFNPDAVEDVHVYKGNYPARYGGRLGSVVDVQNRSGNRNHTKAGVSLGLLASRAFVEGPFGSGSYMVATRRSTLEPVLIALNQTEVEGIPESFRFYDVNARLDLHPSARDLLTISFYTGRDVMLLPFMEEEATFDVTYGNQMLSSMWTHDFTARLTTTLTGRASRYYSDPEASITAKQMDQRSRVEEVAASGSIEWEATEWYGMEAGLEAGRMRFRLQNYFDGRRTQDQNLRAPYANAYLHQTVRPGAAWTINAGLRTSYFAPGDYLSLEPRFSIEHRLTDRLRLQGGYGRYYQHLTLETNETISAFDQWMPSDVGVPPSYGDQFVVGMKADLTSGLRVDMEGYYRSMEQLFRINPFIPDRTEGDYADAFIFGHGFAYGAEFLLKRVEGWLNGFVGYTLGLTRRRFAEINEGQLFPPRHDRTHDLNVVANVDVTPHWRVSGVFNYATGQAYSPAVGQYRMVDEPLLRGRVPVIQSRFNAGRLPPYHRLDVGVTHRGQVMGLADYEMQLQVINVYGQRNIWFYFYNVDTAGEPERKEIPQIPVALPNVSFSVRF